MKIVIEQNLNVTGPYKWSLLTGPEHIDEYDGISDSLSECFIEISRCVKTNNSHYS